MRFNSMMNIAQIEQKINKKDQKRTKIVTFLFGACLNQIFKILNNGYRQGPSFYLFLKTQNNLRKKKVGPNKRYCHDR